MDTVMGWWFAAADDDGVVRLPRGDGRVVRVGETLSVSDPIVPCESGLHASRRVIDALRYAPGPWLARVTLSGTIVEATDKLTASARTTLWLADVGRILHTFACDVAERALIYDRRARGRELDPRAWKTIAIKRRWIDGEVTDVELAVAMDTVRGDAWGVATAAALADARDAAKKVARASLGPREAYNREAAMDLAVWEEREWQDKHLLDLLREAGAPVEEEA